MTNSLKNLAQRREELLAECALQREQLAVVKQYSLWQLFGLIPEKGNMLGQMTKSPILWLSSVFGLMSATNKKRGIFSYISLAFLVWKGWKQVVEPVLPFIKKLVRRKKT